MATTIIFSLLLCVFSFQVNASSSSGVKVTDLAGAALEAPYPKMPFKLGFEFQEVNGLCDWALDNNLVQKKPIFEIRDTKTGQPLWHLVIDSADIEFVTYPFDFNQKDLLERCMQSIFVSFSFLIEKLNEQTEVPFGQWLGVLEGGLLGAEYTVIPNGEMMSVVARRTLKKPSEDWKPGFTPQATIQHPLEFTIPLYFNLYGHDHSSGDLLFVAALPFMDFLEKAMREGDSEHFEKLINKYTKEKEAGLIFLHALTLVSMKPLGKGNVYDCLSLRAIEKNLRESHQVDAKMKLPLMSRRPFSLIWRELREGGEPAGYAELFKAAIQRNKYYTASKTSDLFASTNYAEQLFSLKTGEITPLPWLVPLFKPDFYDANKDVIDRLLSQGVISTAMVRNFRPDAEIGGFLCSNLLKDYYLRALGTVDTPDPVRLRLNGETQAIEGIEGWGADVLSPPLLLEPSNSMGRFRDPLSEEEKIYGEAIVEVRGISEVSKRFLEKADVSLDKKGKFLKDPSEIGGDAVSLFNYLNNFGRRDINDFRIGLPYTILKGNSYEQK